MTFLLSLLLVQATGMGCAAFAPPTLSPSSPKQTQRIHPVDKIISPSPFHAELSSSPSGVPSVHSSTALGVLADAPIEKDEEQLGKEEENMENDHGGDWILSEGGGFLPNLKAKIRRRTSSHERTNLILQVTDIQTYKEVVVDEPEKMVCVRFYAPWCRACRAVQPLFLRLARNEDWARKVKFVEVPLTESNAFLHQGLGIPSLPFAHLYHPDVGLVEERKLNKNVFKEFVQVLETYVEGQCTVNYDDADCSNIAP